jgi:DNA topoisomerase VI subunit B
MAIGASTAARRQHFLPNRKRSNRTLWCGTRDARHDARADEGDDSLAVLFDRFLARQPSVAKEICDKAGVTSRTSPKRGGTKLADALYHAIQETKIKAPATDCISPIGEPLLLEGLRHVLPREFYCAATRPPSVYRGNPFIVEVGLAYGGVNPVEKVSRELLSELLAHSDARTLRQFLISTFDGLGPEGSDKILNEAGFGTRHSPGKLKAREIEKLHGAMRNVNISEGQSMQILRFANRVPLQFKLRDCAITDAIINTNWRSYGLSQSRGAIPAGPVSIMVHIASVWVPLPVNRRRRLLPIPRSRRNSVWPCRRSAASWECTSDAASLSSARENAARSSSAISRRSLRPSARSTVWMRRSCTTNCSRSPNAKDGRGRL